MKSLVKLLALLLCLLILAGCGPAPEETAPPEQTEALSAEPAEKKQKPARLAVELPQGFDPYNTQSSSNRLVLELVTQPLFTVSARGEAVPVLAKGWGVSVDGMTTTVYLQSDVSFQDGTPLTASAVVESVERAREGGFYAGRFRYLTEVTAAGSGIVIFKTSKAYECFPRLLDIPIVTGRQDKPFGTGPYTWDGSRGLKRADTWQQEYPLQKESITFFPVSNSFSLRDGFQYGGIFAATLDPNAPSALGFSGDFSLWSVQTTVLQYVGFNLRSGVFANGGLRSALTYAIDRSAIVQEDMQGFGVPAVLAALPGSSHEVTELKNKVVYEPQKLKANVISTAEPVIMIVSTPGSQRALTAQRIADSLEACGIDVELQTLSPERFRSALQKGEFDLYYAEARLSPDGDLSPFFTSQLGYGGLSGYDEMLSLCDHARANSGNAYDLHKAILTDGLLCPVAFKQYALYVHQDTLQGVSPKLNGWILN